MYRNDGLRYNGWAFFRDMRQSKLFTKTRREAPTDETAKNAELLIRAGYIHKELAGVYSFLPLGHRTLNKLVALIREEMDAVGGQELLLSALQDKELWSRTDRWDDEKVDNWFKTTLKGGGETGLAIPHEEPLTRIMTEHVSSHRDLPLLAYQFQMKFRNELRARSGIIRGREFLMKDMYSFAKNETEHRGLYEQVKAAYRRIFDRAGIGAATFPTFASGGIFSEFSEEFQTLCDAGEDTVYVDEAKGIAVNKEVLTDVALQKLGLSRAALAERRAVEVGNIFTWGTRFSEPLGLSFLNEQGERAPVFMGSYGLGPSRLMGVLVEGLADGRGLVWPKEAAPFALHLLELSGGTLAAREAAESLYGTLSARGVEVLYDDRDLSAGTKFTDADLIGIPFRAIVSEKPLAAGAVELSERASGKRRMVSEEQLFSL